MPKSKLAALALALLSIAVNTAACERYFSELVLIHTAKRNRMSPEKARKLALVRKQVREFDAEVGPSKGANTTRSIDPTQRTRLRDRDDVFECNETEDDIEEESVVGPDTAFEYWQSVLCELEGDDDAPVSLGNAPDNTSSPQSAAAAATAEERRFGAVLQKKLNLNLQSRSLRQIDVHSEAQ
ncbi:NPP1 protein [Phytophthora nicotianae]|uniref:NPP1 protein n=1 Tax=Phytophthora nicotianae TaxID=4792 RepID=A0A0W8CSW8_PHYNI|nr:NPP1 protein [Phytophthora nicotianae]